MDYARVQTLVIVPRVGWARNVMIRSASMFKVALRVHVHPEENVFNQTTANVIKATEVTSVNEYVPTVTRTTSYNQT